MFDSVVDGAHDSGGLTARDDRAGHWGARGADERFGRNLIIELTGGVGLDCPETIERALRACAKTCGVPLLSVHLRRYDRQGVSGVAVLPDGHVSVHTWPEAGYGAFDLFTGGAVDSRAAAEALRAAFGAGHVGARSLRTGAM